MVGLSNNALHTVNTSTGVATRVGSAFQFGVNESGASGLASIKDTLYMVGYANDVLYTVNTTTGVATRVGSADEFGANERGPTGLAYLPPSTPMPDPDPDPDPMPDPDPEPTRPATLYMLGGRFESKLYTLDPSRATKHTQHTLSLIHI